MRRKVMPLVIVGVFWLLAFGFAIFGYGGGLESVTGNVVLEGAPEQAQGIQAVIIVILFFTNIVTLFFLIRTQVEQ